jgi:hypothetical protein
MTAYINGRPEDVLAIEQLTAAVKRNNELTEIQNRKMTSYTWWLLILTSAMTVLVAVQIVVAFVK